MTSKEWIKLWIKTLRSGKYKQGKGTLCQREVATGETYYCCLGVLVHLVNPKHHKLNPGNEDKETGRVASIGAYLPSEIGRKIGIAHSNPKIHTSILKALDIHRKADVSLNETEGLACLNDAGYTFKQIADIIEAEWLT